MLCDNCGKNQATYHMNVNFNGLPGEVHLCAACLSEMEGGPAADGAAHSLLDDIIGGLMGIQYGVPDRAGAGACPACGTFSSEIASSGKAGCARCYSHFSAVLDPIIQKLHPIRRHVGRAPEGASAEFVRAERLRGLNDELRAAVASENYEQAAVLRDRIREMEGGKNG